MQRDVGVVTGERTKRSTVFLGFSLDFGEQSALIPLNLEVERVIFTAEKG